MILILLSLAFGAGLPEINVWFPEEEGVPTKIAQWCEPPVVNVCKDSEIKLKDVEGAFLFLNQPVVEIREVRNCHCQLRLGEIQFASTTCKDISPLHGQAIITYSDGCISSGIVIIRTQEPIVLTHETGHALGWTHTSLFNHVMNPEYEGVGWFKLGME